MQLRRTASIVLFVLAFYFPANAQRAEALVTLNEPFFDSLLDAVFQNVGALEFPIARAATNEARPEMSLGLSGSRFTAFAPKNLGCPSIVRLLKEANGVRTAVRFRDGKIYAPIAFSGAYSPPFVGCVDFAGWAEANIDLEFDAPNQRLIAKLRVLNVALNGTGGAGGTIVAKMIQSAIDKKVNPVEIMRLDKMSFMFPLQNAGTIKMRATGIRPEIVSGALNIYISFEFAKG